MEMCYDGALVMPSSYAVMSEDAMTYVDGGYYLEHEDCNALRFAIGATVSMNISTVSALITTVGTGGITALLAPIPVMGWIAAAYGGVIIVRSAESIASGLVKEAIYQKGMDVNLDFNWFTPYINCSARTK